MSQGQEFLQVMYGGQTSAYGTAATPNTVLARVQSFNGTNENGFIYDRGLGNGINAVATYLGPWSSGGQINFSVVDFDFLKHWIGQKSGAGSSGDPYTLTEASIINVADAASTLQPFTLEAANTYESTDSIEKYIGCVGQNFTLSGEIGGKLECNATFVAQQSTFAAGTPTSYTPNTNSAFVMINGTWKWGATPSALSGVRRFSISYDNGLVTDTRSLDSRFIGQPVLGQRTYNFSFDILMTSGLSTTLFQNFYGTATSPITVADGSSAIIPTADLEFKVELVNGSNYANIWLDQCSIDRISKPQSVGGGVVVLTIEGTARQGRSNAPITWWTA